MIDWKKRNSGDCPHLVEDISVEGIGQTCTAKDVKQCVVASSNPPNCPFHTVANIPKVQKQWFMMDPKWTLVALGSIEKIDKYIAQFF